jgi:hypothetical protein
MKTLYRGGFFHLDFLWVFDHLRAAAIQPRSVEMCHVARSQKPRASRKPRKANSWRGRGHIQAHIRCNSRRMHSPCCPWRRSESKVEVAHRSRSLDRCRYGVNRTRAATAEAFWRLVRDDGEWFCSLSRQPELPIGYDETAEATHESLPAAILLAFVQARRATNADAASKTNVPQLHPIMGNAICYDNFA